MDRNEAVTIRGVGSAGAAGTGANWYAEDAGSARFGSGSGVDVSEVVRGDGGSEPGVFAGIVIWAGSKLSTRSSLWTLPDASTSATQLTTDEFRDMTSAAAATRHNVPTTTVLGASDD